MPDSVFYNIALIFDAIDTYSKTLQEYTTNSNTPETENFQTDSNGFFTYLSTRLNSIQDQFQQLSATNIQQQADIDQLQAQVQHQQHNNQQQRSTSRLVSTTQLETTNTMLKTNIALLEAELDSLQQQRVAQENIIAEHLQTIDHHIERHAIQQIEFQKLENENASLTSSITFHKNAYVKLRTDFYKLDQSNSSLRLALAESLIQQQALSDSMKPLQQELQQWKTNYETLQLSSTNYMLFSTLYNDSDTLASSPTSLLTPSILLSTSSTTTTQYPSKNPSTINSHPALSDIIPLIRSFQLEIKLLRFQNSNLRNNRSNELIQSRNSTLEGYYDLYTAYYDKLTQLQTQFKSIIASITHQKTLQSTLLDCLIQSTNSSLQYRQAYFQILNSKASIEFDNQILLSIIDQLQSQQVPSSVITQLLTLLQHFTTMLKLDRARVIAPLLISNKFFDTFRILSQRYHFLLSHFNKLLPYKKASIEQSTQLQTVQLSLEQLQSQLGLYQSTNQQQQSQIASLQNSLKAMKNDHFLLEQQSEKISDLSHQTNHIQAQYDDLMTEKKRLQQILQQTLRENDSLRDYLRLHGISATIPVSTSVAHYDDNSISDNELSQQLATQNQMIEKLKAYITDYREKAQSKLQGISHAHQQYKEQAESTLLLLQNRYNELIEKIQLLSNTYNSQQDPSNLIHQLLAITSTQDSL